MQLSKIQTRGQITLPRMRLAEALERYPIDQPIDDETDRREWQAEAAADVLGD